MRVRFLSFLVFIVAASVAVAETGQRLPTGAMLDPVAASHVVGNFPLAMAVAPGGDRVALLLCGWREQGVQIVDRKSGAVLQTLPQPAAFIGLAFSADGKSLYTSGGNDDSIFIYRWNGTEATADGKIELAEKPKPKPNEKPKAYEGIQYPAGIAISRDGRFLYAAENLGDSLAVIDLAQRRVIQQLHTDRYPYAVVADRRGNVYVSAWGDNTINVFRAAADGTLRGTGRIVAGRHPSAMLLRGSRLYVASASTDSISIIDAVQRKVVGTLKDSPPGGPGEGSTPNALAISRDGGRLFVAEADNNAVAVFDLATKKLLGRVPAEWYPSALAADGDDLLVVSAKGRGSRPNARFPLPLPKDSREYTLGQIEGSLLSFAANTPTAALQSLTKRVARANNWDTTRGTPRYPPFKHVLYIIKENRTYDQIFGDVKEGDGDPSRLFFGEDVSPNHHALARRFGLFDRFLVNAEVSAQGHNWSTAAYGTDYLEKTTPSAYSSARGRSYDYEGTNRDRVVDDDDDVNAPAAGYLWDLAVRKKISLRNYGEFVDDVSDAGIAAGKRYTGVRRGLRDATAPEFPGFNLDITDQTRVDAWLREFKPYTERNTLPALEIMRLPNDHTRGAAADKPTPRAFVADNDLALGRIVEAVSHSPFWKDTAIFVLEDDAQAGPDHVDSHRSVLLMISAWNRAGVVHRFVNTTDVIATMEEILGLDSLSQFDHFGRPLRAIYAEQPDLTPYDAIKPTIDFNEKNPPSEAAKKSSMLNFSREDAVDDDTLNRILWSAIKGDAVPYPGPTRAPVGALMR
jgi:DNA-binding beta-propeller fold protein YncE